MSTTTLKTRIALKVDTLENWNSSSLKLLNGEVAIATAAISAEGNVGVTEPVTLIKVGTAEEKTFSELPFSLYAKASDVLSICKNEAALTEWVKNLVSGEYSDTLSGLSEAIDLLNDDADTEGSVANSIKTAIDALNLGTTYETIANVDLVRGRVSDIETSLAEGGDTANAIKAAKDAADAAQEAVDNLADYVGTIPNDTEGQPVAADVISYINKKTDGIATDENLTILAGRVSAIENAPYASEGYVDGKVDALANGSVAANTAAIAAINDTETGILKQAKEYVDTEDKFYNGITTVNALGGIGANTSLDNKTTHEILDMLLFPYVAPSITSSSRTAAAATLENGASQTLSSCSISVTKKSKTLTKIALYNGSTLLEEKTGDTVANGGTITFNGFEAIIVTKSNNPNLKFIVSDTEKTNAAERSVGASTFVYPYYWGVCAADAAINEALVEGLTKNVSSKGNKTDIPFTCANQKMVFAYPKAHGALKSIIDPNNFETIDGYARSEVSITGLDGTTQVYYVYVQKDACTVTDFKVDFKY